MESKLQLNTVLPLQKSEFRGPSNADLTSLTIGQYFKKVVDNYGDNPAIIVKHQDVHWTYLQYWREVERVACGLIANGVEPGDRVGIWSPNNIEWSLVQMATARIGAFFRQHLHRAVHADLKDVERFLEVHVNRLFLVGFLMRNIGTKAPQIGLNRAALRVLANLAGQGQQGDRLFQRDFFAINTRLNIGYW